MVESTAGAGIGYSDELYRQAGAEVVADAATLFASAELIVKVKEPQAAECARLRPGQILFTYLHLAPDLAQTQALLASGATCIAYETVTQREGGAAPIGTDVGGGRADVDPGWGPGAGEDTGRARHPIRGRTRRRAG